MQLGFQMSLYPILFSPPIDMHLPEDIRLWLKLLEKFFREFGFIANSSVLVRIKMP
jgi:hypothetical protein